MSQMFEPGSDSDDPEGHDANAEAETSNNKYDSTT